MLQNLAKRVNRKDQAGFTLVELLMVIVVLAILAAVVVFSISSIKDKGHDASCRADLNSLTSAEEANYANPKSPTQGTWVSEAVLSSNQTLSDGTVGKVLAQPSKYYDISLTATGYDVVPQTSPAPPGGVCPANP